jgi:peroxiredoxin
VDLQGKRSADSGASLSVPLEGAPTIECGVFVEIPGRVGPGQTWQTSEEGRPPCTWEAVGPEMVRGTSCVKLVGVQKSDDWGSPRADRAAWRRTDTVWVEPRLGVAYRVERVIERCEPAHREPTQRSVLRYERDFIRQLSGAVSDDCRAEILQALAFRERAAPLLAAPARYAPQLTALLNKINAYVEHQPETPPYREAVLQVKRRVEAARRGEAPPVLTEERPAAPAVAAVGVTAPDFLVANLTGPGSARLRQWLGRPVLLVFYHPSSPTAPELLRYAQRLQASYGERIAVLGMSVSGDVNLIQRQRSAFGLTFPVLNGSALRTSYAVEATPKVVVLDAAGVVRGEHLGWGRETPGAVLEELKTWLSHR